MKEPNAVGWWAFEGKFSQNSLSKFRHVAQIVEIDGQRLAIVGDDYTSFSDLIGEWTKLSLPWEEGELDDLLLTQEVLQGMTGIARELQERVLELEGQLAEADKRYARLQRQLKIREPLKIERDES